MTDTRELVERLRQWDGCWPASGLDHDVERAADTITALSERCRVLEEALQTERSLSDRLAGALEYVDDYSLSYPDLGVLSAVVQPAIQDHDKARAALTSGGRG